MLHRRYAPMSRAQALERYNELPLPSTSDEHWRFTDLRGFDPESYAVNGAGAESVADSMLEIDAAGIAEATEGGIEIVERPGGDHVRAARATTSAWGRSSARRTS